MRRRIPFLLQSCGDSSPRPLHLSHESQTIRPCFCTRSLRSYLHWPIKQSHLRLEDVGDGEPHELCGFPESSRVAICRILDAERSYRSDLEDVQHSPRMPLLRLHLPNHPAERISKRFVSHEENHRSAPWATVVVEPKVAMAQTATSKSDSHRRWGLEPKPSDDRSGRETSSHAGHSR